MARKSTSRKPLAPVKTRLEFAQGYLETFPTPEAVFSFVHKGRVNNYREVLTQFQDKFTTSPLYAFEWADAAIQAAARLKWHEYTFAELEKGHTVREILEYLELEVKHRVGWVPSYTSPTSNLADNYERAALVDLVRELENAQRVWNNNVETIYAEIEGW